MNKRIVVIFLILVFLNCISFFRVEANIEQDFKILDGTLIKGDAPEVFLIKFEKRHWIKTPKVFSSLGYKWQDIIKLSNQEINQYALGAIIASVDDLDELDKEEAASPERGEPRPEDSGREPIIRIGIYSAQNGELFKITANGPYEIYRNNQFLAIKNKGEIFEIRINHRIGFKFMPKTKDTIFEVDTYKFRGNIELKYSVKSKQVWIINELGLEEYLKGVAELIDTYPIECLKSLIIAARSYAFFHIKNSGKYPGEIFHLRNWAYDQVYQGYEFELKSPNVARAVEETKGIIATYPPAGEAGNNKPILGVFSSDSGGITKDACKVWGEEFCGEEYNYLRGGIKDPKEAIHNKEAVKVSHGVGISAIGARKLAEKEKTYQEILKYYYQGIELGVLYSI